MTISDDDGSQEGPAANGAASAHPTKKPRASRALKSKVLGLESQMQQVQASLDGVMAMLQKSLGGAAVGQSLDLAFASNQGPKPPSGPSSVSPRTAAPVQQQQNFKQQVSQLPGPAQQLYSLLPQPQPLGRPTASSAPYPMESGPSRSGGIGSQLLPSWDLPNIPSGPPQRQIPYGSSSQSTDIRIRHLSDSNDSRPSNIGYEPPGMATLRGLQGDAVDDGDAEPSGYSAMRSMLRAEDKARLEAEGIEEEDGMFRVGQKRRRLSGLSPHRATVLDPVDAGLCTEAEGQQLFKLFFDNSHAFMPVFDPTVDTWYSLRQRSPFCISAIIYIAKKLQEGGYMQSDTQKRLRDHVESIGRGFFFSPAVSVEILQAMIILSAWGDTVARPGFMALSMAYDMDLQLCLPRLAKLTTPLVTAEDIELNRSLVVGARLWLITAKQSIEMSINYGRPLCVSEVDIVPHMHAFLHQPSTIPTDSRIVASCEHLILELPVHRNILSGDQTQLDDILRVYNEQAQAWLIRWQCYYEHRGVPSTHILFSDLHTQLAFGIIQCNSYLLRSVRSRDDLDTLSLERRRWLLASLDHARQITQRIIASEKDKLFYANHFSHIALASVFRIYIRLASLFPERVDLRRTAKDLTAVADILSQFPGVSFAHKLRQIIQRARQSKILPDKTRASTPLADGLGPGPMEHPYNPPAFDPSAFDIFGTDLNQPHNPQEPPIGNLEGWIGELLLFGAVHDDAGSNDTVNNWLDFPFDFGNRPA